MEPGDHKSKNNRPCAWPARKDSILCTLVSPLHPQTVNIYRNKGGAALHHYASCEPTGIRGIFQTEFGKTRRGGTLKKLRIEAVASGRLLCAGRNSEGRAPDAHCISGASYFNNRLL